MFTKSLWNEFANIYNYPSLNKDIEVDVAIVGAGVTGISTAHLLTEQGLKVAVLESRKVGGGTSSHSTGNLYCTVEKNFASLFDKYDEGTVKHIVDSRKEAINKIEELVEKFNLDCDFQRLPWNYYSTEKKQDEKIEKEIEYGKKIGIDFESIHESSLPTEITKGIKLDHQAQVNPMRYVQELANSIVSDNCKIFECTRVQEINENSGSVSLHTTAGKVNAKQAVFATHIPKGIRAIQNVLSMHREYGIACEADNLNFPKGIFWGLHANGKMHSTRIYEREGKKYLIVVGEGHRVGQAEDNVQNIQNLEKFAKDHYGVSKVVYRWGGQNYKPADLLPYIGRESIDSNIYIATGFATDGLVYGTLSGILITDEIVGKENQWKELYKAHRHSPIKAAKKTISQSLNVAAQYLKDLPGNADEKDFKHVKNGEGAIVEKNGEKLAVHRTNEGKLHCYSAVCTHMKCIVNWNNAEKTWDCPCHASRFDTKGEVLEGPAYHPLHKVELVAGKIKKDI